MQGYSLVFERLNGLRMNNVRAVIAELDGIDIGKFRNQFGIVEPFRIGIQNARNVFPDGNRLSVQAGSENGGRVVGSVTTKRGRKIFGRSSYKALRDADILFHQRGKLAADRLFRL